MKDRYIEGRCDERARILAILRRVSPNAGPECKLLLRELACAIEELPPAPRAMSIADAVRDWNNKHPFGRPKP